MKSGKTVCGAVSALEITLSVFRTNFTRKEENLQKKAE